MDRLRKHRQQLSLSEEGQKFIELLKTENIDKQYGFRIEPVSDGLAEMVLITDEPRTVGILMIFAENAVLKTDGTPVILLSNDATTKIKAQGIELIDKLVIIPEDYPYGKNIFRYIHQCFSVSFGKADSGFTLSDVAGYDIVVNTNMVAVDAALNRDRCNGVPARIDFGAVVKLKERTSRDWDQNSEMDLFAFGGYVDFVRTPMTVMHGQLPLYKHAPQAHISCVRATIPDPCILSILLPVANELFVQQNIWAHQMAQRFDEKTPNIGALAVDKDSGRDYFITDHESFFRFLYDTTTFPTTGLLLDMNVGTVQMPWWNPLMTNQNQFAQKLGKFMNAPVSEIPPMLTSSQIVDWTGVVRENDKPQDSRIIDFLRLRLQKADRGAIEPFLNRYINQPQIRAKYLMELGSNYFRPLYYNQMVDFTAPFISFCAQKLLANRIRIIFEQRAEHGPSALTASTIANAEALKSMPTILTAHAPGVGVNFVF
jgi:hypothetical protein